METGGRCVRFALDDVQAPEVTLAEASTADNVATESLETNQFSDALEATGSPEEPEARLPVTESALVTALRSVGETICKHVETTRVELLREVEEMKTELRAQVRPLKRKLDKIENLKTELETEVRPLQYKIEKLEKVVKNSVMTSLEVLHQLEFAQSEAEITAAEAGSSRSKPRSKAKAKAIVESSDDDDEDDDDDDW